MRPARQRGQGREVALTATGLVRHFGTKESRVTPVDGVDIELRSGELVTLGGPSGSGKSTLLHLLTGFDLADSGTVCWAGVPDGEPPPWHVVGVVAQSLALVPELMMSENIVFPLLLAGVARAEAVERARATMVDLDIAHLRTRLPAETSLGQQQRAAVARAIVLRPRVILADEPTSHQDEAHGDLVMHAIRTGVDGGSACLVVGHDQRLDLMADRHLRLLDGRLFDFDRGS